MRIFIEVSYDEEFSHAGSSGGTSSTSSSWNGMDGEGMNKYNRRSPCILNKGVDRDKE